MFSLIGDELLNEFISGGIAEELSRILTIFDKGGRYADVLKYSTDSNIRDIFYWWINKTTKTSY